MFALHLFCLQATEKKFLPSKKELAKLISLRLNIIGNSSVSMELRDQLANQYSGWLCIWRVEWKENESVLVVCVRRNVTGVEVWYKKEQTTPSPTDTL